MNCLVKICPRLRIKQNIRRLVFMVNLARNQTHTTAVLFIGQLIGFPRGINRKVGKGQ